MENEMKSCSQCGTQVPKDTKFCPSCGAAFGEKQPQSDPAKPETQTERFIRETAERRAAEAAEAEQARSARKGSGKKAIAAACAALALGGGIFAYKKLSQNQPEGIAPVKAAEAVVIPQTDGRNTQIGNFIENGFILTVESGTFPDGAKVSVKPLSESETAKLINEDEYTFLQTPVDISCDQYNGAYFSTDVVYTVPIPEGEQQLDRLFFAYADEKTGELRLLYPDSFDLRNSTASVTLPHFSTVCYLSAKNKKELNQFLDTYSTKLAAQRDRQQKAAAELEPYVKAKIDAMGLTKEAGKDLLQSTINFLGGRFQGDEFTPNPYGNTIETGTKTATALLRGVVENNMSAQAGALEDTVNGAIMHAWDDMKMTKRIDKVLGSEFAGSTASKLVGSTNGVARMAGLLADGDWTGAAKELGGVMQGIHPAAELTTKTAAFLANGMDLAFIEWKQNEIEELYKAYKSGAEDRFGNEIEKQDPESLMRFLETSSGPTIGKMVYRFYKDDNIKKVCEKYGWDYKEYSELKEKYRDEFERRAKNALLEYFNTRIRQEDEAERIRKQEEICVNEMLDQNIGVLNPSNFQKFFGESEAKPYSVTERMERLLRLRSTLSYYVNEDKLSKASADDVNWGTLLNWWAMYATEHSYEEALQLFLKDLQKYDLLKSGMESLIQEDTDESRKDGSSITGAESTKPADESKTVTSKKEKTGFWKLKETNTQVAKDEIGKDGYASTYYSGSDLEHHAKVVRPKTDYHGSGYANFDVTCSSPPDVIQPGEKVVMEVTVKLDFGGDTLLWSTSGSVSYGTPSEDRCRIKNNAGTKFTPVEEGGKKAAYLDTIGNTPCPSIKVYHEFGKSSKPGTEIGILFYGAKTNTLFIYEWVEE